MGRTKKPKLSPFKIVSLMLSAGLAALIIGLTLGRGSFPVLQSAGPIASGEQQLLIKAFMLMLIIVIPVFVLTFYFVWRYREGNTGNHATYKPNWDHSRFAESVWWTVPTLLIIALSVMTWKGTYAFDPYKPLAPADQTLNVQVVALDWRWLFIYPDQGIASINELRLPVNTAVRFDITADAPMNSFWIPQLGGQMYAMPGMGTRLNLQADKLGSYRGSSANISGKGFANMHFQALAVSKQDFTDWTSDMQRGQSLTMQDYNNVAKQSLDTGVHHYGQVEPELFGLIMAKYGGHGNHGDHQAMEGM